MIIFTHIDIPYFMLILSGVSQVPTRWQVEAAEQKAREEEEANRIIAAEAKKKLIEVIINPDNYYGHDLPNVPYGTTMLSLFYLNVLYYIISYFVLLNFFLFTRYLEKFRVMFFQ